MESEFDVIDNESEISSFVDFQKQLLSISKKNMQDIINYINSKYLFDRDFLIHTINTAIDVRCNNFQMYMLLLKSLKTTLFLNPVKFIPDSLLVVCLYFEVGYYEIDKENTIIETIVLHENSNVQNMLNFVPLSQRIFCDWDVAKAIREDDLELFQSLVSMSAIDINSRISNNEDILYKKPNIKHNFEIFFDFPEFTHSLIKYASFHGSVRVFKFLYINDARIDNGTLLCAIAGGNPEIIHLLEKKDSKYQDEKCIEIAIKYHRNEIVEYLHEIQGVELNHHHLNFCLRYNNFISFLYILDVNPDLANKPPNNGQSIFETACRSKMTMYAKALLNHQSFDINQTDCLNEFILFYFIFFLEIFFSHEYILKTPIFKAVKGQNVEIAKIILSKPNVDLNRRNITVIFIQYK